MCVCKVWWWLWLCAQSWKSSSFEKIITGIHSFSQCWMQEHVTLGIKPKDTWRQSMGLIHWAMSAAQFLYILKCSTFENCHFWHYHDGTVWYCNEHTCHWLWFAVWSQSITLGETRHVLVASLQEKVTSSLAHLDELFNSRGGWKLHTQMTSFLFLLEADISHIFHL